MKKFELETGLKALWGATEMPFGAVTTTPFVSETFEATATQLEEWIGLRLSGVVSGVHGVGKTMLLDCMSGNLSPKEYLLTRLTHTTLAGSDLLCAICLKLGIPTAMRRSATVDGILRYWASHVARHPVLIVDEAQNLSSMALEELRLLCCGIAKLTGEEKRPPPSLVLAGDDELLPRLDMGINKPLQSRLGFYLKIQPLSQQQAEAYIEHRFRQVGVHHTPLENTAITLVAGAAQGIPRIINQIMQLTLAYATKEKIKQIRSQEVQLALNQLPWLRNMNIQAT